jgi:hypothetical protein
MSLSWINGKEGARERERERKTRTQLQDSPKSEDTTPSLYFMIIAPAVEATYE